MAEILEPLVSFFCPTSDSASACREFISNHSQVMPPVGPLFYFLLFPLVFTILFIYILSSTILKGGSLTKGMQMLIGVSVFIFIIINGWYPIMLFLSEVWFFMIILLFGMWYFIGKHKGHGGGGGGGKGNMPGLAGGAMGGIANYTVDRLRRGGGDTLEEEHIKRKLKMLHGILNQLQTAKDQKDQALHARNFVNVMEDLEKALDKYHEELGPEAYTYLSKKYKNEIQKLNKAYENLSEKLVI